MGGFFESSWVPVLGYLFYNVYCVYPVKFLIFDDQHLNKTRIELPFHEKEERSLSWVFVMGHCNGLFTKFILVANNN